MLNGHDHIYERFAPQTPTATLDNARGIREFIVGTGGANHTSIASVATNSVARRWLGTWLPEGYTTNWYTAAWKEFQLGDVLWVTIEVVFAVVFLALLVGVPAAYTLARRNFVGKRLS